MKTSWTQGLDADQKKDVVADFKGSLVTRKRLSDMLQAKLANSVKGSHSKDGYDNPNWAYLQADARGYERALSEVISLISE